MFKFSHQGHRVRGFNVQYETVIVKGKREESTFKEFVGNTRSVGKRVGEIREPVYT